MQSLHVASIRLVERLTSEQIRLLEELRELRDAGILTVDEFELQVATVLGRPLVVKPSPVGEILAEPGGVSGVASADSSDEVTHGDHTVRDDGAFMPETSTESELLEYEFDEPEISDEFGMLAEENQVVEPLPISESSVSAVVESEPQHRNSFRRKVLIGTTACLVLITVIGLITLVGGGKSDTTSSQVVDGITAVTQSTSTERMDAPTTLGNTQAPATPSQSVAITTTFPQNASSGNSSRPTTSIAAGSTLSTPSTVVNNDPPS